MPYFFPTTRSTLVAPMLPEPWARMSMPLEPGDEQPEGDRAEQEGEQRAEPELHAPHG